MDGRGIEPVRFGERIFIALEQSLGLGVTQDLEFLRGRLFGQKREESQAANSRCREAAKA